MQRKPKPPSPKSGRRPAVLSLLFLLLSLVSPSAAWAAVPANAEGNAQKLLQYTNAERSARDMNSLGRSGSLDSTAQKWAEHLASEARMYHSSDPAKGSGFNWRAENLAYWEGSEPFAAEKIHSWWMNSKVHRNNIVHPGFTHMGFGMACEIHDGVPWVFAVAHFGGPSGPVQNSDAGQASGGGSTTGMTCTGGSDPPPPATAAAAEPEPSESGTEPESPAAESAEPPAAPSRSTSPQPSPSTPATGKPSPAAASASESEDRQPTRSQGPQESQEPNPDGSPSPEASAAAVEEPPPPAAARLRTDSVGAAEPANGPLWILAGLVVCALAVSARRRNRPQPKHAVARRRLPWK